jgi:hypothetical protein
VERSYSQKASILTRKGIRPKTIRGLLHIQCDGSRGGGRFRELIAEVLSWTNVECIPSLANSPDFISIHLKQGQGTNGSAVGAAVKRFAQVYMEAPTIILTLPLVTAHWAILRGWAEPHYLASQGLMPAGTVLLYTPTDESELAVCRLQFSRAYELARTSAGNVGKGGVRIETIRPTASEVFPIEPRKS